MISAWVRNEVCNACIILCEYQKHEHRSIIFEIEFCENDSAHHSQLSQSHQVFFIIHNITMEFIIWIFFLVGIIHEILQNVPVAMNLDIYHSCGFFQSYVNRCHANMGVYIQIYLSLNAIFLWCFR